jgi:hypothetical protein
VPPPPDLPEWLYEQAASKAEVPDAKPSSVPIQAKVDQEGAKYLKDIRGVLPAEEGWLASAVSSYLTDKAPE